MFKFPTPSFLETPDGQIVFHAILIFLVSLPVVHLILQFRRSPSGYDLLVYVMAGIAAFFAAQPILNDYHFELRGTTGIYLLIYELLLVIAFVVTFCRFYAAGRGPTVLDVLAIFMVLAVLAILFLPTAVVSSRQASLRTQCVNNLKQIGLAMQNFHDVKKRFPSPMGEDASKPPISWRVSVLPYIEQQELYDAYDQNETWNSEENDLISKTAQPNLICPSNLRPERSARGRYFTDYSIPTGDGTFFGNNESRRMSDATAGTSNTFMAVEACGQDIIWSQPKDISLNELPLGINLPGMKRGQSHGMFSSFHIKGFNAVLLDGSASFYNEEMDEEVLREMLRGTVPED